MSFKDSRKYLRVLGVLFFLNTMPFSASASDPANASPTLSGRDIIEEVSKRHDAPFELEKQKMFLISRSGDEKERTLDRYSRENEDDLFKYLIVFHSPNSVRGTGLLTWQNKGKADSQWVYLPALGKKLTRQAEGSKKNYFLGSDFAFEDLTSENRDNFRYDRQADETRNAVAYFVVDAYPVAEDVLASTGYKYRRLYIRQDTYFIEFTDYFDRRGRLLKILTNSDLVNVKDDMWRANTSFMDNKKRKTKTRLEVQERVFGEESVPEKLFKHRYLLSKRHMR